jgi:hypothetical protein
VEGEGEMAAMVVTPLDELDLLRRRLAEVERWKANSVRDVALRFLREQLTALGREIRSPEFLRAVQAYARITRPHSN